MNKETILLGASLDPICVSFWTWFDIICSLKYANTAVMKESQSVAQILKKLFLYNKASCDVKRFSFLLIIDFVFLVYKYIWSLFLALWNWLNFIFSALKVFIKHKIREIEFIKYSDTFIQLGNAKLLLWRCSWRFQHLSWMKVTVLACVGWEMGATMSSAPPR